MCAPGAGGDAANYTAGGVAHLNYFKMRGKDAFGRDRQTCSCSDQEHYA